MQENKESNKTIDQTDGDEGLMQGTEITQEQMSDVYAAGTSDGVYQLENKKIKLK